MKRTILSVLVLFSLCSFTAAQEVKNEVTVQGSGFFTKESTGLGTTHSPTYSGGVMAGYRLNINRWLAAEGDYDYFRNTQKYFNAGGLTTVKNNVHAVTGSAIIKIPTTFKLKPYGLVGGGAMVFDPRDSSTLQSQTVGTFVYGGGADYMLSKHVGVRGQYRGFVYKTPYFDVTGLKTDKFTHSAVPSVGFVLTF